MSSVYINFIIRCVVALSLGFYLFRDTRSRDYNWTIWVVTPVLVVLPTNNIIIAFSIAIIILGLYVLMRPKGQLYPCPHCKCKIHPILAFCPFCHKAVKRDCLKCFDTVDWNATRCPHCNSTNLTES